MSLIPPLRPTEGTVAGQNLGWRLENIICIELLRRCKPLFRDVFYFKTSAYEVDFVISDAWKPVN